MKRLIKFLLILVILLVPVLLIGPSFIDWNKYKPVITGKLTDALGLPVEIAGNISFKVLPNPALTAEQISVAHAVKGTKTEKLATLEKLEASLALAPLFSGQVQAGRIRLIHPVVNLEMMADGRESWKALDPAKTSDEKDKKGSSSKAAPDVRLDNVRIEDGGIAYIDHKAGSETRVDGITMDLTVESLSGPYSANGQLVYNQMPMKIDAAAGRFAEGQTLPLRLTLVYGENLATLEFSGVADIGKTVSAQGELKVKSPDLGRVAQVSHPMLNTPLDLRGDVTYSDKGSKLGEVKASLGEIKFGAESFTLTPENILELQNVAFAFPGDMAVAVTGQGSIEDKKFKGRVAGKAADLRASLSPVLGPEVFEGIAPEQLKNFVFSTDVDASPGSVSLTGFKLASGDIRAGGTLSYAVRKNVPHLNIDLTANSLDLAAFGIMRAPVAAEKKPAGKSGGSGKSSGSLPVTTFDIGITDLKAAPWQVKNLRAVGRYDNGALALKNLSLEESTGASLALSGDVANVSGPSGLDLKFSLESKNLDAVLKKQGLTALLEDGRRWGAGQLGGTVKGDLKNLAINLNGRAAGGDFAAEGSLTSLQSGPGYDLKARVKHPNMAQFAEFVRPDVKAAGNPGPLDFYARIAGNPKGVKISDVQAKMGKATVTGAVDAVYGQKTPAPTKVTANIQTSYLPLDALMGLGTGSGGGVGGKTQPATPKSSARFSSEPFPLDWPKDIEATLNFTAKTVTYGNFVVENSALAAKYANAVLDITQLDGQAFGGKIGLTGRFADTGGKLDSQIKTNIAGARIESFLKALEMPPKLTGVLNFNLDAATSGKSTKDLVAGLSGKGGMFVQEGVLYGINLSGIKDFVLGTQAQANLDGLLQQNLFAGNTPFKDLKADFDIQKGVVTSKNAQITTGDVQMVTAATVNLPAWRFLADSEIRVLDPEGVPPFEFKLSGPIDGNMTKTLASNAVESFMKTRIRNEVERKIGQEIEKRIGKDDPAGALFNNLLNQLGQ